MLLMNQLIAIIVSAYLLLTPIAAKAQIVEADDNAAVIFAYQRIGEDQFPETNIRREQFEEHIKELISGEYNVLSLEDIIAAIKNGTKLPARSVVLTFDGGHRSVMDIAVPLLKSNNLPFTIFIPTNHIDRGTDQYMSWNDIKALQKSELATIGLHPASYLRLYEEPRVEIIRQINSARARYREELGREPNLFAYPFGEYSQLYKEVINEQGFEAALSQQSSVAHAKSDVLTLPRFTMTESHGGIDRFRLTANALPLPVKEVEPQDPLLKTDSPSIGFTVDESLSDQISKMSCFVSGQSKPELEIVGKNRVELRLSQKFETPRTRVNCTLPVPSGEDYEEPRWRWLGMLLISPQMSDG